MDIIKDPTFIAQISVSIFLAIVFLQSGIDKVVDWKGNLAWLKGHFKATFLSSVVTPMLAVVTIMEIATGLFAIFGIYCKICCDNPWYIYHAVLFALISLLMLLFGQRIAKDYDGAKTIAIYFCIVLVSLLFF